MMKEPNVLDAHFLSKECFIYVLNEIKKIVG